MYSKISRCTSEIHTSFVNYASISMKKTHQMLQIYMDILTQYVSVSKDMKKQRQKEWERRQQQNKRKKLINNAKARRWI